MSVKNIVIVGGGYAGTQLAIALEKFLTKANDQEHRIILVEKKSYFYHSVASLRTAIVDIDNKIMIPYTKLFSNKKHRVVQASVVDLGKDQVGLDQSVADFGNNIPFAYLILATGTSYPAPAKASALDKESAHANLSTLRADIKAAKSIVIVGGGPVGIELCGEIRDHYKDTKITLVHNQATFLQHDLPKLSQKVIDLAQKNSIDTIFDDAVIVPEDAPSNFYHPEGKTVSTKNGKTITDVDLVILAYGNRPETDWLKNTELGTSLLSPQGYVKVLPTLQVDHAELTHVFVLGDAANLDETKLAFRIRDHIPVVVQNIGHLLKNSKPTATYKKGADGMFITFGTSQGAGLLPLFGGIAVGNFVVSNLKGKSLFIGQTWKGVNLVEPSS